MLQFSPTEIQRRTFLKAGMISLLMKNLQQLDNIMEANDIEKLNETVDFINKMRFASSKAIKKYIEKEGYSYDYTPCDQIYRTCSDVLKAFFETEDLYQEQINYLQFKYDYVVI